MPEPVAEPRADVGVPSIGASEDAYVTGGVTHSRSTWFVRIRSYLLEENTVVFRPRIALVGPEGPVPQLESYVVRCKGVLVAEDRIA